MVRSNAAGRLAVGRGEMYTPNQDVNADVNALRCLYGVSELAADPDLSIAAFLVEALRLIPQAWHHPDLACARIVADDHELTSPAYLTTRWQLSADIVIAGEPIGTFDVCYLAECPTRDVGPFTHGEVALVGALARHFALAVERKRSLVNLRESERSLNESQWIARIGNYALDIASGRWTSSVALDEIFGIPKDFARDVQAWTSLLHPNDRDRMADYFVQEVLSKGGRFDAEYRVVGHLDQRERWVHGLGRLDFDAAGNPVRMVGTIRDMTEQVKAAAERQKLEEQLRAAQKLEAIGVLAGGVAHDFNNLLTVILGNTLFSFDELAADSPVMENLREIKQAAETAAALTRQLLAFSRQQALDPFPLDLNQVTVGISKILRRLLREDIQFVHVPGADLGLTLADPGQMEQVLMNLVINARDAMPDGGRITVETSNVEVDESDAPRHPDLPPGAYVQLAVTDNGCGMDEQIQRRIFEPFFTTKEVGKGTGLGMSTVYGIVKQSGGSIAISSQPGAGTTVRICLPRE